jgi:adenylate kinase
LPERFPLNVVLLGPPGAGKGTHAFDLSRGFRVPHISTGDIFREEMRAQTELGKLAQSYIDDGHLVPDDVVVRIAARRLKRPDARRGFILDGFPRTIPQAEKLDEILRETGKKIDTVVYLETPPEASVQRLSGRRVCRKCGANYHLLNIPPRQAGICDRCGGELYQREDDRPEAIRERFKEYQAKTEGLINYYRDRDLLTTVDAGVPRAQTLAELEALFRRLG